jgi:hypothetical protein
VAKIMPKAKEALPLHTVAVEILEKKESMSDDDLFDAMRDRFPNLSRSDLNALLFKLEIEGIIRVPSLTKSKRQVELVKRRGQEMRR